MLFYGRFWQPVIFRTWRVQPSDPAIFLAPQTSVLSNEYGSSYQYYILFHAEGTIISYSLVCSRHRNLLAYYKYLCPFRKQTQYPHHYIQFKVTSNSQNFYEMQYSILLKVASVLAMSSSIFASNLHCGCYYKGANHPRITNRCCEL
ncbi:hypothetical protein ONS95_010492 [Cadophora gregata]|uniref:uncharacterized protein n=1 Tax=Cadophora gregata TaxID=51156 RepID=UPI0026DA8E7F|nr:uncharacterized protein ONS95_010492 [Cadophora gregata]KAK0122240.1 hypothetical protein ONS95_010492 [Cadophora gregata]